MSNSAREVRNNATPVTSFWEIGSTALELLSASHRVTLDNGKYYFKEFYRWAEQNDDFLRWLDSLKNMWLESIIE